MVRLFIKDNSTGNVHEYGSNHHDSLYLMSDGSIHYVNMQNCCGTEFPEEGYSFCLPDGKDPRVKDDFRDEPILDIGGTWIHPASRPDDERKVLCCTMTKRRD